MPYLIRPAAREELPETVDIYLECIRGDYGFKPKAYLDALDPVDNLKECESWLYAAGKPNQIFAAFDGDRMAGYIAVGPNVGEPESYQSEVGGFFMRQAYRSRGIGLKLLQVGLEYLRGLGFHNVIIYNYRISRANSYYRALGGEVVHQEIQSPGGMALETDVFGWEIKDLLATVSNRLKKYDPAGFLVP